MIGGIRLPILLKVKNIIGYLICVFFIIVGFMGTLEIIKNPTLGGVIAFVIAGILPFWFGLILINGKEMLKFKKDNLFALRLYLTLTVLIPIIFQLIFKFALDHEGRVGNPKDVYMTPVSQEWMVYTMIFAGLLAAFPGFRMLIVGWENTENHLRWMFLIGTLVAVVFGFITRNDYMSVRTDGIVVSKLGEKEEISWPEVDYVEIDGHVGSDGFSRTSTSSFKWSFFFRHKDGRVIEIGDFSYNKYNLKDSLAIKDVLKENKIPWKVHGLTEKEWDFVEVDMDYEEGNPKDFYAIFQYDPKTKEPYDIPFD
jgi:hypothetical protein